MNDLVYVHYNRRLQERFKERREKGRNFDPLVLDELDWNSEWIAKGSQQDLVYPDSDLTWLEVDTALGASTGLEGRNLPRVSQRGSSRWRATEASLDEVDEVDEEIGEDANDDGDVEDDFGNPTTTSSHSENTSVDAALDDAFV